MPLSETIEGNLRLSPGLFELQCSLDPWWWAQKKGVRLVSSPFTYEGMEFQHKPMTVKPPVKVICKATQMGFTEAEVLGVLHGMIYDYYPTGVYYLHPNKEKVSEFSKSRFNPLIKDNPDTIGQYVKDTDSATLKRIGSGFLFFRSGRLHQDIKGEMKSSAALKGDPADHAVHDEYDEMEPKIDEFIDGRLARSPIHTKSYLSNPTIPDYMIDKKFQESSMEYWHIRCAHCKRYTCLDDEDNFPKLFHEKRNGIVIRACSHCGLALDPRNGEWVAKRRQEKDILGFTIGHPSAWWINPKKLLDAWNNPETDRANFIRLRLGRAYIEAENRLSEDEVLALCGTGGIASSDSGPCFMGVDQGGGTRDLLHVVIGKKHPAKKVKYVHIGYYKGWEELDRLMRIFHVRRCVVDGLPNTDDARKFAKREANKGRVYLCYFNENQKGYYKWNEEEFTVTVNRTEALDYSHKELAGGEAILPRRTKEIELFAFHCHNIAKKLEEDEVTGSKRYIYIKLGGKDHYRFAQNYEAMARVGAPAKMFEGA